MAGLVHRFLGGYEVNLDGKAITGFESNKVRALLAYLAVEGGRLHRRETLAGLLWPDWPQQSAMSNLRYALADLRKNIGDREVQPPFLLISRDTIQVNPEADIWVDVVAFEQAEEVTVDGLKAKVELYTGAFLKGFSLPDSAAFEEWQTVRREQLQREMVVSLGQLVEMAANAGDFKSALEYAHQQVGIEPWLEEGHRLIMRLLALDGQRGAALAQYENCRMVLEKELGVTPGPETDWVYESIREGKLERIQFGGLEEGRERKIPPEPGEAPFKGLQFFDIGDADLFFGREALTSKLVGQLRKMAGAGLDDPEACCFLSVVGASGSGKSSVVRAGLVPALQRGVVLLDGTRPPAGSAGWQIHIFTPTAHPLEAMAVSLTRDQPINTTAELLDQFKQDDRSLHLFARRLLAPLDAQLGGECRLLVVVDQFEELFTLCRSEVERTSFVNNLLQAVRGGSGTMVVVVLRADFYGHCAQYPLLREALCVRQEYIGAMSEPELRSAIEQPAERYNWQFEPGLVELILRDVGDEPGALPLLEHALLETWRRRSGRTLTVRGYADSGGVHGAIAQTAENVYAGLADNQKELARRIFLRLTELGEGTQDTRRRVEMVELAPGSSETEQVEGLLKTLADARLVTLSEDTAEVAHEALIREWPTLREWLSADREGLRLHRHLTESAEAWAELARDPGELYRGARLAQALEWSEGHAEDLNELEREFLQVSRSYAEAEALERENQRIRELEAAQRLARTQRQRSLVLSVGLAVAVVLIGVAFWLYRVANQNLDLAVDAQETAQSEAHSRATQAAIAENESALSRSRELAAAAVSSLNQDPQLSLLLALEAYYVTETHEAEAALHQAVQASHLQMILNVDPELKDSFKEWTDLTYSPNGKLLAAVNNQNHLQVFDTENGTLLYTYLLDETLQELQEANLGFSVLDAKLKSLKKDIWLEFFPDGRLCFEGRNWFVVLEGDSGQEIYRGLSGMEGVIILDTRSEEVLFEYPLSRKPGMPIFVEYTPTGLHILVYSQEENDAASDLKIFNITSGEPVLAFHWNVNPEIWYTIDRIEYSSDGSLMALTPKLGEFEVWNLNTQKRIARLRGMPEVSISDITFSPDNSILVVRGENDIIKVWKILEEKDLLNITGTDAFFSLDSEKLIVIDANRQVYVWHIASNRELYSFLCHPLQSSSALSYDGKQLASGGRDGSIHLCEVAPDYEDQVWISDYPLINYGYAPEPGLLGIASSDNVIHFFNAETGELYKNHSMPASARLIGFYLTPTGAEFATTEENYSIQGELAYIARNWETVSGDELARDITTNAAMKTNFVISHPDGTRSIAILASFFAFDVSNYDTTVFSPFIWMDWVPFDTASYSPDGSKFALSKIDGRVGVFEDSTYAPLMTATLAGGHTVMDFDPSGEYLAVGNLQGGVTILAVKTGEVWAALPNQTAAVNELAFSPDGSLLATGSADGVVRLWDVATSTLKLELIRHGAAINFLAFTPSGTRILSGSEDGVARSSLVRVNELLSLAKQRVKRTFSPQEKSIYRIESSTDYTISNPVPTALEPPVIKIPPFPIPARNAVQFPSRPSAIISRGNIEQITELGWLETDGFGFSTPPGISPDGNYMISSSKTLWLSLFDFNSLQLVWEKRIEQLIEIKTFSSDSAYLATAGEDGLVHLFRTLDGTEYTVLKGHTKKITGLAFSPDGSLLASSSFDDSILLHSVPNGTLIGKLINEPFSKGVMEIAFSPDGKLLASGSGDGKVRIWDIGKQQVIREFQASEGFAASLTFSPDGKYLTTWDSYTQDGSRVWNVVDGTKVFEIPEGAYPAFFPDGSMIITKKLSFNEDNQYIMRHFFWDAKDGRQLHMFDQPGLVNGGFVTPDQKFLVTGAWDSRIHFYGIP